MNERNDFDSDEHFADFVKRLTEDKANDKACSIDNPDCIGCGS